MDTENRESENFEENRMGNDMSNETTQEFDEEFAAEYAPFNVANFNRERNESLRDSAETDVGANTTLGIISLVFALASWFIYPLVLGPAAAVFGFIAWYQGSRTLGGWSIALGVIAFLAYMVLPLYT
ncbi:hypothetical protein [Chengkuizengella axinellae]|uniref:DUF4190 domain-containing protein n=1 Tax=Chengkuizengella axinellae TaxID=3064388 RepID=A0ABT9IUS5_9BACL|nr:hypothetical protein [Chengkuizengella sp. 2205SS18-9]MDP5273113.1 hypothetical protein [Chengkuizengella sp. 2205SS18-9]